MMANQFVAEIEADADAEILGKKQLCMMENSETTQHQPDTNNNHQDSQCTEDFFDTGFQQESRSPRKHRQTPVAKTADDNEPPVVYSEENSSITRTVRDQFAVALLKLQTDLEATGRRLSELESAVRNSTSTTSKLNTRSSRGSSSSSGGDKWQSGNMIQILYIGWPMIVYITMRYMERRSLANKLA